MADSKQREIEKVREEIMNLKESSLCRLRIKNKTFPVIGEGNLNAKIMFIGEAPGKNESETGKPFCGASGKVLFEMLNSIGLERKDVYITNLVNDRPPQNRDPKPSEIKIYSQFLDRQINIIKPKVIATLGRYSMSHVFKKFGLEEKLDIIGKIHGKVFDTKTSYGKIKIIPLYHPAAVLYRNKLKKELSDDFKKLKT